MTIIRICRTGWRLAALAVLAAAASGCALRTTPTPSVQPRPALERAAPQQDDPVTLPESRRVRLGVSVMGAYLHDDAVATLGFEKQGRIGYAIVSLSGELTDNSRYRLEINPVNETRPLPACTEPGFFFPNEAPAIGPRVPCDPDGRLRVDDYRFIALDPVAQQGIVRQAYVRHDIGWFGVSFGRFRLPIGFDWEAMGSFTAKDATHIQRINAESNFGMEIDFGSEWARLTAAAFLGGGNRFRDYDYFYFQDGSLDANSALTLLLSGRVALFDGGGDGGGVGVEAYPGGPTDLATAEGLQLAGAWKWGDSGSKVERVPYFFGSKRRDRAVVLSANYRPNRFARVFGEYAHYTWGLTPTSAQLLDLATGPLDKPGYYVGAELSVPIWTGRLGVVATRERLRRDDSLIAYLGLQGFDVALGREERATAWRFFADIAPRVTVAVVRNDHENPYPWVSGIEPIAGPNTGAAHTGSNKWGLVIRYRLR